MVGGAVGLMFSLIMSVLKIAGNDDALAWPVLIAHIVVDLSLFIGGLDMRRRAKIGTDRGAAPAPLAVSKAVGPDDVKRGKSVANEEGQEP